MDSGCSRIEVRRPVLFIGVRHLSMLPSRLLFILKQGNILSRDFFTIIFARIGLFEVVRGGKSDQKM